jgi:ribosomal protein S18 acetylase RimI-like enzyme
VSHGTAIRPLVPGDAAVYAVLRREALLEAPLAFHASPGDDFVGSLTTLTELLRETPDWVIIGAFSTRLIGALGVFRERRKKASHKAHVWGMYVSPHSRGHGIGTALLAEGLRHARALAGITSVHLSVSTEAEDARRLYERAGFRVWGTEPDALHHEGRAVGVHHLTLLLR